MDREKVITSVVASMATAAILYVGASFFNFFTISLDPTDIPQVAREFVNDEDARKALLSFMAEDEGQRFRGPRGEQGGQGERGEQGPLGEAPSMISEFFSLSSASNAPASETAMLGEYQFCSLSRVHLPHASQACGCILQQENTTWTLDLVTDPNASGACRCTAVCASW